MAIVPLMLLVWACSAAGDSVCFALGRRLGRPFLARYGTGLGLTESRLDKVDGWLDRYGPPAVCFGRLLPLARPFGPFVAGASHFPYRRFLPWSVLGTLLFTLVFCGLGYVFYNSYDEVAAKLGRGALAALVLIIVGVVILQVRAATAGEGGRALIRSLTIGVIVAAGALLALVMFDSGGDYTVSARFENASQVVRGGLVEIAGKKVGTVADLRLTDDGLAELELSIDDEWAPLPRGTHAQIRQFGLSGPASRYVDLSLPTSRERGELPDGGVLGTEDTTAQVELDQIFATFDRRTRASLRGVFRGSARQYAGPGRGRQRGLALPRSRHRLGQPAVQRADARRGRAAPLRRRLVATRGPRGGAARRPRRARVEPGGHHQRDRPATRRSGRRDQPAAAVHAACQHHLREPASRARRPRPAGGGRQAGGSQAAALHRRAAALRRGRRAGGDRPCARDPPAGGGQRPRGAGAGHPAAARHRRRAGPPQRRGARGRVPRERRGAVQLHSAGGLRAPVLRRLHRLARRLLPQRQLRRAGRLRAHRHPRERLHVQERGDRPDRTGAAGPVVQGARHRSARTTAAPARQSATPATAPRPSGRRRTSTATRGRCRPADEAPGHGPGGGGGADGRGSRGVGGRAARATCAATRSSSTTPSAWWRAGTCAWPASTPAAWSPSSSTRTPRRPSWRSRSPRRASARCAPTCSASRGPSRRSASTTWTACLAPKPSRSRPAAGCRSSRRPRRSRPT